MKKYIYVLFIVVTLPGCNNGKVTRDDYLAAIDDSLQSESLIFWTSDTTFSSKPDLFMLLDTLYQYVQNDSFPSSSKEDEKWMKAYRKRLCEYYDDHYKNGDKLNEYEKVNCVLDEGRRLIESDKDDSTMGMIVKNSIIYTFEKMREYSLLTQMLKQCKSVEIMDLIYKEWDFSSIMSRKMGAIGVEIAELTYWRGSILGPISTERSLEILHSRIDSYQNMLDIISNSSYNMTGVFMNNAIQLLLDCSMKAVNDNSSEMREYLLEEELDEYDTLTITVKKNIKELEPLLKEWSAMLDRIDNEMTNDASRYEVKRAASGMLLEWTSMVCSRW